MPAAKNKECKKAIRFISNSTKNYTQPESLDGWCKLAKTKVGYDKCADSFSRLIRYRLDRIEDLKGYSLMEKVRLVFLFSRPVTDVFVKELNDNKCVVKLNDEKKITYFRSPDGNYVLQSEQDSKGRKRKFKEKPIHAKERIASRNDDCEKAIKFMSNGIKNCTEPESLIRWCELAKTETEYDKSADSFVSIIKIRLNRIEDLKGYSLMEKVRLVFLFSRPLSDVFVEELKDTKCIVELNDKRKITYFRSPTGDCVLQSDQDPNPNIRRFKGKAIHDNLFNRDDDCEKAIKFMSNGIKNCTQPESLIRWCEVAKTETGYDKCASSFSFIITRRLDKIEDLKGYSLTEKVHLVFMFSRPVSPEFLRILREEKCVVKLNGSERIAYFRSPDGTCVLQSDHNNLEKYFKGKPYFHKMRKAYIKVRSSDNVQDPPPPASPQSLPDPPEIDDVEMRNGEEEAAPEQEKQENEALERKKEKNKGTSTKQKSILHTEEDEDVTTESIQQEAPFNGPIDYDDMDIEEYPEFMVSNEIEPPMQHNKRHRTPSQENPKRRKIDKPEEPELANPPEINDVETRNEEGEEAPEKILETVPDIERSGRQCITRCRCLPEASASLGARHIRVPPYVFFGIVFFVFLVPTSHASIG